MSLTLSPGMMSRDNEQAQRIARAALITAGVVIIVLTGAAFWLSYAHLAEVAGSHGLGASPIRQWAWPATLDLFIVSGELLMLVAGLKGRRDWWAVALTVAGSVGSIGLNVAGVGADAEFLDYVVAAVPPTAALLAFGALMRQVHLIVSPGTVPAEDGDKGTEGVPAPVVPRDTTLDAPVSPVPAVVSPAVPEPVPAAVSRTRAAVPAVSPARPSVHIHVDKTVAEIKAARDTEGDKGQAKIDVPEEALGNLTAIVRFLRDTDHTEKEIRSIVPTLPGHEETADAKRDSLKKAIQRTRPKEA
ncbi:DUF2637 domain-containing protein [Streptomyces sp. NPDC017936]|uniref:DUF2637 domain-containing protein n=1 Tax=Streptomyces sp. NPDC017936 TaxID=3365016 RepID=UPI0037B323CB